MNYVCLSPQHHTTLTDCRETLSHHRNFIPQSGLCSSSHYQQNNHSCKWEPLSPSHIYMVKSSSAQQTQAQSELLNFFKARIKGRLNMDVRCRECEREVKETEHEEDTIHTVVLTAGTVLLMVCLKRFLVEQWRAWVFLILNLILLAILFMSLRSRSSANEGNVEEVKNDKTKKKRACACSQEIEERKYCYKEQCWTGDFQSERDEKEEEEIVVEEEEMPRLSKEELNERVEAFIAMFRQHLVSDAKQAENFRFQKNSNMTAKGLRCLVVEA